MIDRKRVYEKYNGHGAYCGCKLEYKDMQVDHILAKSNGGSDDIDNLNPSCRMCNYYKSCCDIETFRGHWGIDGVIGRLREKFLFRLAERYGLIEIKKWDKKFYFEKVEGGRRHEEEKE